MVPASGMGHPERRLRLVEAIGHATRAVRRRPPVYSITSSARSRIDGGTARPSAVAVLRFTTTSNFVGAPVLGQGLKHQRHKGDAVGGAKKSRADSEQLAMR